MIEILLALAVIGLLGGVMVVNMSGITGIERLRAAARKLAGMSDFVRSHAVGKKQTCYLTVDFDLNRYRFWQEPPRDAFGRYVDPDEQAHVLTEDEIREWRDGFEWEDLPTGVYFRRLFYSPKLYYDKGIIDIEYRPNGTLDAYILWLQAPGDDRNSDGGLWYSVVVNGLSGKSEVRDFAVRFPSAVDSDFREVMGSELPGGR